MVMVALCLLVISVLRSFSNYHQSLRIMIFISPCSLLTEILGVFMPVDNLVNKWLSILFFHFFQIFLICGSILDMFFWRFSGRAIQNGLSIECGPLVVISHLFTAWIPAQLTSTAWYLTITVVMVLFIFYFFPKLLVFGSNLDIMLLLGFSGRAIENALRIELGSLVVISLEFTAEPQP